MNPEESNALVGWTLSLRPANYYIKITGDTETNPLRNLNLDTLTGFAGVKESTYVNIRPKAKGDEQNFYREAKGDSRPNINLRLERNEFEEVAQQVLSQKIKSIELEIEINEKDYRQGKLYFTADIYFNFFYSRP